MPTPFVTTLCLSVLGARATTYLDTTASSGKSTFYGGNTGGGACGYEDVPTATFPFGYYAACGGTAFDDGYGCGACYEITCIGPYGNNPGCSCDASTPSVIVSCMDQCPECAATHFDLDPTAMARIVGDGLSGTCGVIETSIRRVACEYTGNIKIRSKSGTSAYWFGLHIDDVAGYGAVSEVRIMSSGSVSYETTCTKGQGPSFWICGGSYPLVAPLSVELTSDSGEILTCDDCIESFAESTEWDFGANFESTSVSTPSSASTPSPVTASNTPSPVISGGGGGSGSSEYIVIRNGATTQNYYLSFYVDNIDASSCGDSVANVQVLQSGSWRSNDQYYDEAAGHRYAFNYIDPTTFGSMLPISVRIVMASTRVITLYGIIMDLGTTSEFTSDQLICDGTLSPTAPTPQPTTRVPTAPTTPYPTGPTVCIDEGALQWRSYNNQLYLNGNVFAMKGLSWFGFETGNYGLYGLDVHDVDWYLDWMVDNGFNAIRLPFSQDFIDGGAANQNAYKAVVQAAGAKGLLVMPDFHSKTAGSWLDGLYTVDQAQAIATWETMADLLGEEWNVFIADVFNEPHDVANSEWASWVSFCEDVAEALWRKGVNWLVAVEGTNWQCDVINCAWGENLEGVRNKGVTFSLETYGANRFVWSPHVYGADVTGNPYSTAGWESHWGYLVDGTHATNEAASLIGEFGTRYSTAATQSWLDDLVDYLIAIDQRNTFFWCLNPNSGDTGGLLMDDWTTPETGKLTQLAKLQPSPSVLEYNANAAQVCVSFEGSAVGTPAPVLTNVSKARTISLLMILAVVAAVGFFVA